MSSVTGSAVLIQLGVDIEISVLSFEILRRFRLRSWRWVVHFRLRRLVLAWFRFWVIVAFTCQQ